MGDAFYEMLRNSHYMSIKIGQSAAKANTDMTVYKVMVTWPWCWKTPCYLLRLWFPWKGRRLKPREKHFDINRRINKVEGGGISVYLSKSAAEWNYPDYRNAWWFAPVHIVKMVIPKGSYYIPSADGREAYARVVEVVGKIN